MSASDQYIRYVLELLQPLGSLSSQRFFGGLGISRDGVQFAMVMGNSLYFVVDDQTRPKYLQAGMSAFSYGKQQRQVNVQRYYELPEEVLNEPSQLQQWADEALRIALATAKPRRPNKNARKQG